jgi:hypothetical protein
VAIDYDKIYLFIDHVLKDAVEHQALSWHFPGKAGENYKTLS